MTVDGVHPNDMVDPLDRFLDDLRQAASDAPAPAPSDAMLTLFRDGAEPQPAPAPARTPRRRLGVVAAGLVAGLTFGGLGVAGALPASVQERVSDAAESIGIDIPTGRPEHPGRPSVDRSATTTTTTSSKGATEGPAPSPAGVDHLEPPGPPATPLVTPNTGGRQDEAPGHTGVAPGLDDEGPGRSEDAPGRTHADGPRATAPSERRGPLVTLDVHGRDHLNRPNRPADAGPNEPDTTDERGRDRCQTNCLLP